MVVKGRLISLMQEAVTNDVELYKLLLPLKGVTRHLV